MTADSAVTAYSRTGAAWASGPARIYARLADVLVSRLPGGVAGRTVLDLGAGTGVAGRAAGAAGAAEVVSLDAALGVLTVDAPCRPPAVAGDLRRLPFADDSFGAVIAAFALNHLVDPAPAAAEAARVLRADGGLVISAYAADDTHPVKRAVDEACEAQGWTIPDWYRVMRDLAVPRLATPGRALDALGAVLGGACAEQVEVDFSDLDRRAWIDWRLGMAHLAPFVASLDSGAKTRLVADADHRLGIDPPPLVRSFVVVTWCGRR